MNAEILDFPDECDCSNSLRNDDGIFALSESIDDLSNMMVGLKYALGEELKELKEEIAGLRKNLANR